MLRVSITCGTATVTFYANELDALFNEMIEKRTKVAANAGFENFRDFQHAAMHRYDYTPADCATFHDAIEKVVSLH